MKKLGFAVLAIASIFLMVSVALADVAVSVDNARKGNTTRLDFPAGTTATRDPQDLSIHLGLSKTVVNGVRDTNLGGYEYFSSITGNITGINTNGTNSAKTYGLNIDMTRQAGANTLIGDLSDAGIVVHLTNKATLNTAGNTMTGIIAQAANDAGGVISNLAGGEFTAYNKTAGGSVVNAVGLKVSAKANNAVTENLIGIQVDYNRQAATVPTHESMVDLNCDSMTGSGIDSAIDINSVYSGSSTTDSIDNGIDMSGAVINQAQIVFSNSACVFAGSATTRDTVRTAAGTCTIGSIYLSSAGKMYLKVANNAATADWALVSHTDAD